ncbi:MAG: Mut7-C RNAse domain-containing protein [Burkholderiales bacterium]
MPCANFRFYEELNDFLAPALRKREFNHACADSATVKNAIESLGVPHTEVELILANGNSVAFSYLVQEGDLISVYPQFESLDVTPLLKLRAKPLRVTRFIADSHLGRLAKYLRMLGFDTLHEINYRDQEIARIAATENRIVLTRDRALLMHKAITHGCYVHSLRAREQLLELLARLDLYRSFKPFSRCLRCNGELACCDGLSAAFRQEWTCTQCDKLYWQGSHWRRMSAFIGELQRV